MAARNAMTPEQARKALAEWRAVHDQRDRLVRAALATGLEKMEVHQITGIARTTIDRIADRSPSA